MLESDHINFVPAKTMNAHRDCGRNNDSSYKWLVAAVKRALSDLDNDVGVRERELLEVLRVLK